MVFAIGPGWEPGIRASQGRGSVRAPSFPAGPTLVKDEFLLMKAPEWRSNSLPSTTFLRNWVEAGFEEGRLGWWSREVSRPFAICCETRALRLHFVSLKRMGARSDCGGLKAGKFGLLARFREPV